MAAWAELAARPVPWAPASGLAPGPYPFAIFTRLQTFRNFAGEPFSISARREALDRVTGLAAAAAAREGMGTVIRLADLGPGPLRLLRERHLRADLPVRLPSGPAAKHLVLGADENRFAWIHEVEHITFHQSVAGFLPASAFATAYRAPAEDPARPWGRSPSLGHLASDPGRIGPGVGFVVLAHLPALTLTRRIGHAHAALSALGSGMRPVTRAAAEGQAAGTQEEPARFWITSRGGLGGTAEAAYRRFAGDVETVLRWESETQFRCLEKHRKRLEVRVQQAQEILSTSTRLGLPEFEAAASWLRFGAYLGMVEAQIPAVLEECGPKVQRGHLETGHLEVSSVRAITKEEEDMARSNVVRSAMERCRA